MISIDPKKGRTVVNQLKKLPALKSLYSVNGTYDFIALLQVPTPEEQHAQLEASGVMDGVTRTSTQILLSKLF